MTWVWIHKDLARAVHDEQLSEHGGQPGLRDHGLLETALLRPINKSEYQNSDVADLAAAYGFAITRNHPFLDGNKRVAFVLTELFLELNGFALLADDGQCLQIFLSLAEGSLSEEALAYWLRQNLSPIGNG